MSFFPTKATLSSLFIVKLTLSNTFLSPIVFVNASTRSKSLPISRSGEKAMYGYLRDDGFISSSVMLSSNFLRDVACFDFEAFALKRAINSFNSLIFSSFFFFSTCPFCATIHLPSYYTCHYPQQIPIQPYHHPNHPAY